MLGNLQLISNLMGRGFTAPPTSPDLKESGGPLKGERLHLMEKPQFPFLAAGPLDPWMPCVLHKARLCLCVPQKPAPVGERLQAVPEASSRPQVIGPWPPQASPSPRVPQLPLAQRDMHLQSVLEGGIPLPAWTGSDPRWLQPMGVARGPVSSAALGCVQDASSSPPRPSRVSPRGKNLFTSDSHWTFRRSFFTLCERTSGVTWSERRCRMAHWRTRTVDSGL